MDLNVFQSILLGFFSGISEILPISAPAHRSVLLKLFGENAASPLMLLMLHIGTFSGLYYSCHTQLLRFFRARKLAAIPKRKRKRPLDTGSLMDLRMLKFALFPMIIGLFFSARAASLGTSLLWVGLFLLINGLILYLPQFLPGSNKKSDSVTGVDGLLMGAGSALSVLPGFSGVGAAASVGLVCGMDRQYALNAAILLQMPMMLGLGVVDLIQLISFGVSGFSFGMLVSCVLAAASAFGGTYLAVKLMRTLAANAGIDWFSLYSWGAALLSLILYISI